MENSHPEINDFLKSVDFLGSLTSTEISRLLPYVEIKDYLAGSWVFKEGDLGFSICIVKKGSGEVVKEETSHKRLEPLAVLGPSQSLGEMSYLERSPRTASFRALEPLEVIFIDLDELKKNEDLNELFSKIIENISILVSNKLRKTNQNLLVTLSEKLSLAYSQVQFGKVTIYLFIILFLYYHSYKFIETYFNDVKIVKTIYFPAWIFLYAIGIIWIMIHTGCNPKEYGLNLRNWKMQIKDAILYSLPVIILIGLLKWVIVHTHSEGHTLTLFRNYSHESLSVFFISTIAYFCLVPLQELSVRGFMQTCFRNFFVGKHHVFTAILISNIIYELPHVVRSLWLGISFLILGIGWGYLYEKHRSILGVSISHAIIGTSAFAIFDFFNFFDLMKY